MAIETVLLALGTATAKAVARIWIRSDLPTDLSETLIDQLSGRLPSLLDRRRAARQFQEMADRVALQLQPLVQHEKGGLPANERDAAILGVAAVIDALQVIDAQTLFQIDLDPTALEAELKRLPAMSVRADLMESAQLLFDLLLRENCNYIVELTISMPQFNSHALVELLRRGTEIMDRVEGVLARLPPPSFAQADGDQDFDVRYRRHIARELDRLELFGLTLSETSARYDLSIAYITLGAAVKDAEADQSAGETTSSSPKAPVAADTVDDTISEAYLRVDDALARGGRHLIRGEAGSGKTTLLQWLAVTAARQGFEGVLKEWTGAVPFFIQLRRYANKSLPNPSEFLTQTASLLSDVMPDGWVDRRLRAGEGLLLIDGVDELPEQQRDSARQWLSDLLAEYPECKFIVTTRPPAVPEDWLGESEFGIFELLPMSLPDIESFVQHWYDAARRACAHKLAEVDLLDRYQTELVRVIRENSSIRALATAPLLCAMLCALNRDRRTQLPRDRMELYRISLESLLDRRDVEREISQYDAVVLGLREKETLLEDLAYWLILNDQTDVAKVDAIQHVQTRLAFMTSIAANSDDVFAHLLTRSGLIREPVSGRIDFIHRTFQEYLAAARAMKEGNVPYVVSQAHKDQWREVVILSAGHATVEQANSLMSGLIDRGDNEPDLKHRLHLLAVACLETVVELQPETISRVDRALRGALPPTNMTEARAVASAGSTAAPLLAQYRSGYATTAAACVRALCLIGGEAALIALRSFSRDGRVTVTRELIRGWEYFDRATYAEQVLADCFLDYGRISIADPGALAYAHHLRRLRSLEFTFRGQDDGFRELPNRHLVTELEIASFQDLTDISSLETNFPKLLSFKMLGNRTIAALPEFPADVTNVELSQMLGLKDISTLAGRPALKRVAIFHSLVDASGLRSSGVESLYLTGLETLGDGSWLSSLPALQNVQLGDTRNENLDFSLGSDGTCEYLAGASGLVSFWLSNAQNVRSLDGLSAGITSLDLFNSAQLTDASAVGSMIRLRRLSLDGAKQLEDFGFLATAGNWLRHLDLEECVNFSNLSDIPNGPTITNLLLSGTSVMDLSSIGRFVNLRLLSLAGCPIESLEPLSALSPRKCMITIDAAMADLVPEELRSRLRWRVVGGQ